MTTAPEYLTVREVADLLRIKERKVYDLARDGDIPCSRATGKLLFPEGEVRAWIEAGRSGGRTDTLDRPKIVLGSHDPLLDWAIRESGSGLATYFDGSNDGLDRYRAGGGIATGLHIFDADSESWNVEAVRASADDQNAALIRFARRQRGIVSRNGVTDLAALTGKRVALRQETSGTAQIFAGLLAQHGMTLADIRSAGLARTEDEAVRMVLEGEADATFGLASVAASYDLEFTPSVEECFDLLIDRRAWFEPDLQRLWAFWQSAAFRDRAAKYVGYDISELGQVIWNAAK